MFILALKKCQSTYWDFVPKSKNNRWKPSLIKYKQIIYRYKMHMYRNSFYFRFLLLANCKTNAYQKAISRQRKTAFVW